MSTKNILIDSKIEVLERLVKQLLDEIEVYKSLRESADDPAILESGYTGEQEQA